MRVWIAIWTGSGILARRIGMWLAGGVTHRLILIVVAALFARGLPYTTAIACTCALLWIITAIALGLAADVAPAPAAATTARAATDETEQEGQEEEPAPEPEPHPSETLSLEITAHHLRALLQETGGVHLTALSGRLTEALPGTSWTTAQTRSLLVRVGIRVRDGVRVPGVGGREGVHRDDIPPAPSPAPE
ncbi:hypothetical protein, partial [Streptomyces odonnellii]|uniref:hypothetical protein n=1 Tax=Streptomyces odonnellii TaxID=1417980 RepID=UPI000626ECCD